MKITVLQENLKHGLGIVSLAVSSRSVLPVLGNILVSIENGRLRLSATDLEMSITCWIGAKIEREGAATVPARTFFDLVGTLPPDAISLDYDEAAFSMRLQCGSTKTRLNCISAEEYPPLPTVEGEGFHIDAKSLLEMIRQVIVSVSRETARPVLTGVLATIVEDEITFASSDGFRLSEVKGQIETPVSEPVSAIIPAKALDVIARVLKNLKNKEVVTITFASGRVVFHTPDVELAAQLIEGKFVDYKQIIPAYHNTRAVMPVDVLENACRQAGIFAINDTSSVSLKIAAGTVEVTGKSSEFGSSRAQFAAEVEGDGDLEIAFNVRFLQDALATIQTPSVALEATEPTNPGIIRPVGSNGYFHLLMPMVLSK